MPIFLWIKNRSQHFTIWNFLKEKELDVTFERGADFDILMENMGRVNFGPRMEHQRKGIGQCVQVNGHMHNHWKQYTLPLDNIEKVDFSKEYKEGCRDFTVLRWISTRQQTHSWILRDGERAVSL